MLDSVPQSVKVLEILRAGVFFDLKVILTNHTHCHGNETGKPDSIPNLFVFILVQSSTLGFF